MRVAKPPNFSPYFWQGWRQAGRMWYTGCSTLRRHAAFPISITAVGAGHARPAASQRAPARGENASASLANHVEANPRTLAAASTFPGGYGIRPYSVGVDACIDPEGLPPPQDSCGRTMFAPTSVVILKLYF